MRVRNYGISCCFFIKKYERGDMLRCRFVVDMSMGEVCVYVCLWWVGFYLGVWLWVLRCCGLWGFVGVCVWVGVCVYVLHRGAAGERAPPPAARCELAAPWTAAAARLWGRSPPETPHPRPNSTPPAPAGRDFVILTQPRSQPPVRLTLST